MQVLRSGVKDSVVHGFRNPPKACLLHAPASVVLNSSQLALNKINHQEGTQAGLHSVWFEGLSLGIMVN